MLAIIELNRSGVLDAGGGLLVLLITFRIFGVEGGPEGFPSDLIGVNFIRHSGFLISVVLRSFAGVEVI